MGALPSTGGWSMSKWLRTGALVAARWDRVLVYSGALLRQLLNRVISVFLFVAQTAEVSASSIGDSGVCALGAVRARGAHSPYSSLFDFEHTGSALHESISFVVGASVDPDGARFY